MPKQPKHDGHVGTDSDYASPSARCSNQAEHPPSDVTQPEDEQIELNQLIFANPLAILLFRMPDDSMRSARIRQGDMLVVDCSLTPADGEPVVVVINGERTVRRITVRDGQFFIESSDGTRDSILLSERDELVGVARYIIPIAGLCP
jgi:DNA polymerase V